MKTLVTTVLIIAIVIVLIWWIVRWSTQQSTKILSTPLCVSASASCPGGYKENGGSPVEKDNNSLKGNASSSNYTISLWYYVTQWTVTDNPKILFTRLNSGSGSFGGPEIALGATDNNLSVSVACHNQTPTVSSVVSNASGNVVCNTNSTPDGSVVNSTCNVDNVPVQRWVCVLVSVYGRTLDVYVDGKLTKTCLLPGLAIATASGACIVAPGTHSLKDPVVHSTAAKGANASQNCPGTDTTTTTHSHSNSTAAQVHSCTQKIIDHHSHLKSSSFPGYIDSVRYWDTATNPQQAYNIYKDGPSGAGWGTNFFDDYYMEVGFYDKGKNEFSFRI